MEYLCRIYGPPRLHYTIYGLPGLHYTFYGLPGLHYTIITYTCSVRGKKSLVLAYKQPNKRVSLFIMFML